MFCSDEWIVNPGAWRGGLNFANLEQDALDDRDKKMQSPLMLEDTNKDKNKKVRTSSLLVELFLNDQCRPMRT